MPCTQNIQRHAQNSWNTCSPTSKFRPICLSKFFGVTVKRSSLLYYLKQKEMKSYLPRCLWGNVDWYSVFRSNFSLSRNGKPWQEELFETSSGNFARLESWNLGQNLVCVHVFLWRSSGMSTSAKVKSIDSQFHEKENRPIIRTQTLLLHLGH